MSRLITVLFRISHRMKSVTALQGTGRKDNARKIKCNMWRITRYILFSVYYMYHLMEHSANPHSTHVVCLRFTYESQIKQDHLLTQH